MVIFAGIGVRRQQLAAVVTPAPDPPRRLKASNNWREHRFAMRCCVDFHHSRRATRATRGSFRGALRSTAPNGIPPIDDPKFLTVDEVDFLDDREPVLSLEVAGETRAYPIQIMIWHEIVNDTFGSGPDRVPVTVTYCPLCNSGIVFDRTLDGEVLSTSEPPASCTGPRS